MVDLLSVLPTVLLILSLLRSSVFGLRALYSLLSKRPFFSTGFAFLFSNEFAEALLFLKSDLLSSLYGLRSVDSKSFLGPRLKSDLLSSLYGLRSDDSKSFGLNLRLGLSSLFRGASGFFLNLSKLPSFVFFASVKSVVERTLKGLPARSFFLGPECSDLAILGFLGFLSSSRRDGFDLFICKNTLILG